jgi:hypothetical protein
MKVAALCALLTAAAIAPSSALADEKGVFGAGIMVGEPTGVTAKYYLGDDTAVDAAVGFAVLGRGLQAHADYLWHPWILETKKSFVLPAYLGAGARFASRDRGGAESYLLIGARGVFGVLFDFTEIPIDVFVEVAGVVDYTTEIGKKFDVGINLGLGARYYF